MTMLGGLTKDNLMSGQVFTYIQLGSDRPPENGSTDEIYRGKKAVAKFEILSSKEIEKYKFEITAKII